MVASTTPRADAPALRSTLLALSAEWTKLWSVRSTWWCLAGITFSMIFFAPLLGGSLANSYRDAHEDTKVPVGHAVVLAVIVVQLVVVALAMLAITSEYSTGSIRVTLQCVPNRARMLSAKSAVLGPVVLVGGTVLAAVGAALAMPVLFEYGVFDPGATVRTILLTGVYLALVATFAIGLGAAIRSAVGTLTVAFVLLIALPGAFQVTNSETLRTLGGYTMTTAGMRLMDNDTSSYSGPTAVVIVVAWTLAAQLVGYLILRRRDA